MSDAKKKIVVYYFDSSKGNIKSFDSLDLEIRKWMPSLKEIIPSNTGFSYILFWFAYYLNFFKNRDYCAYELLKDDTIVSSLVCVPPLIIWDFMKKSDLQLKSVFTHPKQRGNGFALLLIKEVLKKQDKKQRTFWYLTHDKNYASIRVSEKAGFKFKGYYYKKMKKYLFIKIGKIYDV